MALSPLPRVTLVVDPRFSGGTSTALASEIRLLASVTDLTVAAISSSMFKGDVIHPAIHDACDTTGTPLEWDPPRIAADLVILHNPSFLKFDQRLRSQLHCDRLVVVCHENFLRPTGAEGFDVDHCLSLIERATFARRRILAPISDWNREGVTRWLATNPRRWDVAPENWTNICDFCLQSPTQAPRDRRGRHSRPGFEKFPDIDTLELLFPRHAEANRILGADSLLQEETPEHWDLIPFRGEPVETFLESIDFFVYFTNPCWRESFGRAISEAIAAGKLVITDPETAMTFGNGVVAAQPSEADAIIARHIEDADAYSARVRRAQQDLARFSSAAVLKRFDRFLDATARRYTTPAGRLEELYALL